MDGLNRVLGRIATPLVTPSGRRLLLSPFRLLDLAAEESVHGSFRGGDPETVTSLSGASGRGLADAITEASRNWRAIFRGGPRLGFTDVPHEVHEVLRTPDGLAWRLHRSARRKQRGFAIAEAYRVVGEFHEVGGIAALYATLDVAVGTRDLRFVRTSGGDDSQWRTPWAEQLKFFAREYGWTPREVGRLTLYQYCIALGAKVPESGVTTG